MLRLRLAALLSVLSALPAAAQSVPGRDLLEFPIGALAGPRAQTGAVAGNLWNPAAAAAAAQGRGEISVSALTTPVEIGLGGRVIAGGFRLPRGLFASASYAQAAVGDIARTETDPQSFGEIPYRTSVWTLAVASRWRSMTGAVALRRRFGILDRQEGSVYAADAGVTMDSLGRVPLRLAVGTLMGLSFAKTQDARSVAASADMRILQRDSTAQLRVGAGFSGTSQRARETHLYTLGQYRRLDGQIGLVRSEQFASAVTGARLGIGLRYARYHVGISREDGGNGLGASYQFLLATTFR